MKLLGLGIDLIRIKMFNPVVGLGGGQKSKKPSKPTHILGGVEQADPDNVASEVSGMSSSHCKDLVAMCRWLGIDLVATMAVRERELKNG